MSSYFLAKAAGAAKEAARTRRGNTRAEPGAQGSLAMPPLSGDVQCVSAARSLAKCVLSVSLGIGLSLSSLAVLAWSSGLRRREILIAVFSVIIRRTGQSLDEGLASQRRYTPSLSPSVREVQHARKGQG